MHLIITASSFSVTRNLIIDTADDIEIIKKYYDFYYKQ